VTSHNLPNASDEDLRIIELLQFQPSSHYKHCFRSAIHHLTCAYSLIALDASMAFFRAITAEEEAASGLMRCLMGLRYPRSDELKPKDHVQKHAVTPFINAVLNHFRGTKFPNGIAMRLAVLSEDGSERLSAMVRVPIEGEERWGEIIPPFNFRVRSGVDKETLRYADDFRKLAQSSDYQNVGSFLANEANQRNKLLYASPHGYPVLENFSEELIIDRQIRVINILKVALLIAPYDTHQPFVVDALEAFLRLSIRVKKSSANRT
jgi:hypothetical protein